MGRDSPGLGCAWKEKDEGTGGVPELNASENSCRSLLSAGVN